MEINRLSASKVKSYQMCPRQFHYNYGLKMLSILPEAMGIGLAYHDLLEKHYNGEHADVRFVGVEYDAYRSYLKNPVEGEVVATEERDTFRVEGIDIDISMVIDRMDVDKIVEYKTSSFDYTEEDIRGIQSLLYVYRKRQTTGMIYPMVYSIVNKIKMKQKKYKPQIMKVTFTDKELDEVPAILKEFIDNLNKNRFPMKPSGICWGCQYGPKGTGNCSPNLWSLKK